MKFLSKILDAMVPGRLRRRRRDSFIANLQNVAFVVESKDTTSSVDIPLPRSTPAEHLALARQVMRLQRPIPVPGVVADLVDDTPEEHWREACSNLNEWLEKRRTPGFVTLNTGRDNLTPISPWYIPRLWQPIWEKSHHIVEDEIVIKPGWEVPFEEDELGIEQTGFQGQTAVLREKRVDEGICMLESI